MHSMSIKGKISALMSEIKDIFSKIECSVCSDEFMDVEGILLSLSMSSWNKVELKCPKCKSRLEFDPRQYQGK